MARRLLVALLLIVILVPAAFAGILSYGSYTNRLALPGINARMSRYFALVEAIPGQFPYNRGQVVVYDTQDIDAPRVVFPPNANEDRKIFLVALRERFPGDTIDALSILVGAFDPAIAKNAYFLSVDAGATWRRIVQLDGMAMRPYQFLADSGGPYTRGLRSQVSIGTPYPFVIATTTGSVYGISFDAKATSLYQNPSGAGDTLVGRDGNGTRVLVRDRNDVAILDTRNGALSNLGGNFGAGASGWITSNGDAYVHSGGLSFVPGGGKPTSIPGASFAIPTSDFDGAWMIFGNTLRRHTAATGTEILWTAPSQPAIEALYTGSNPNSLLIQAHRRRGSSELSFLDPALALWHVGEPAPDVWHELYVIEEYTKAFLHVNVDTIVAGSPFVFDSGVDPARGAISNAKGMGPAGADINQEWGVVRGTMRRRLVIPGVARQNGAYNSQWRTDVVLHNPLDEPQGVAFNLFPLGGQTTLSFVAQASGVRTTLAPHEIRVFRDVVKSVFGLEQGGGTMAIDPDVDMTATSRTYTRTATGGTYGFGMPAIDFFNALSPRFSATFAGAFPGPEYRTNLLLTDTSGIGADVRLIAYRGAGTFAGTSETMSGAPVNGVLQMNGLSSSLGVTLSSAGLEVVPTRGSAIATLVTIDNRTNDPTYFPPDLSAPRGRTIPVLGHVDGAFNSKFRSDLFLMNPTSASQTVHLEVQRWDVSEPPRRITEVLAPGESRVIRDALYTLYGMTGLARLRFSSGATGDYGVRVTSRAYAETEGGATYGSLVPPLNSFQSGGPGERLEILGVVSDGGRVNLGLVDLNPRDGRTAEALIRIVNQGGAEIDQFTVTFPIGGGTQINDIFFTRGIVQPEAAILYVEVKNGLIGAYATLTDNVTNDSTYLGANLSAQPQ